MWALRWDNAIESCAAEPDPEKRLIRTAVYVQNGFVMFRFENYCAEPVELGPDGLPARSTHGGYDLKSLRALAQQHGGSMTVHWENQWFTVRMLLPLPKKCINEREHFANCTNAPSFSLYISTIEIETDLKLLTDYVSKTTDYEETEKFLCGFVIL